MKQTSLEAYRKVLPKIGTRQRDVLEVIRNHEGITNCEIAEELGWSINRITGRVLELREMGLVEDAGVRMLPGQRKMHGWKVCSKQTPKQWGFFQEAKERFFGRS